MPKKRQRKKKSAAEEEDFPGGLPEPSPPEETPADRYLEAAGSLDGWAPAGEVFDDVTAVPTVFPDFNRASRIGGLPVGRIHTVHGPTHGGKTVFVLGLVKSFVDRGFLAGYIDAEHALGREFTGQIVQQLQGKPNFLGSRPETYELAVARTDTFLDRAMKIREKHPEAQSILAVDSINKLVPKRELEKLLRQGVIDEKGAAEMAKGHQGRYRAALNQAWLDQLTPKLARAGCALVLIAQEREEDDGSFFKDDNFKVKGGQALLFDASMLIRVSKAQPIFLPGTEKKSNDRITGWRHRVRIWKSKVGHMDGRYTDCVFHLSNGKLAPPGLDTARDAVTVGLELGVVKKKGSWLSYRNRRSQGEDNLVKKLGATPERLQELLLDISEELAKGRGSE